MEAGIESRSPAPETGALPLETGAVPLETGAVPLETGALPLDERGGDQVEKENIDNKTGRNMFFGWLLACLTSQQQASVSQGRICSDKFTCCHTEIEVADQTFYLTQSQNTDTGPTSPSADPITPGAWQGIHWSANF